MSEFLAIYIAELETLLLFQRNLQKAYVKLQGREDEYIKGIIKGLEEALRIVREFEQIVRLATGKDGI